MNLQEFVRESLLELSAGISEANIETRKRATSDAFKEATRFIIRGSHLGQPGSLIDFDIALTLTKEAQAGGGGRLNISVVDLGGGRETSQSDERVSRIKFSVEVQERIG